MTLHSENFEGGTNGNSVTGTIFGAPVFGGVGGTAVFSNTHPAKGNMGVQFQKNAGSGSSYLPFTMPGSTKAVAVSYYVWCSTWPAFIQYGAYNGTTRIGSVTMNTALKSRLTGSASASDHVFTSTVDTPTSTLLRFEVYLKVGTTTSNGEGRLAIYLGDSTTALTDSGLVTGMNLGTADIQTVRFGIASTSSEVPVPYFDAIQIQDAASGLIGPWPATPSPFRWWDGTQYKQLNAFRWNGTSYVPLEQVTV